MAILKKSLTKSFGKEIKKRVHIKVVVWLDVKPASILQHPNVVCTVRHEGASPFYDEGI